MSYLALLKAKKVEKALLKKPSKPSKPSKPGFEGFEGFSGKAFSENCDVRAHPASGASITPEPARWQARLAALDPAQPLCGITPTRWQTLLADARWLADVHGDRAAAEGWNASDLFGIDLGPGRSGLADRLDGARTVYIFAEHATWQRDGWRWGMVPLHRDLPPLWKLAGPTRNRR